MNIKNTSFLFIFLVCLLAAIPALASPHKLDLSKGFSFEKYLMSGKGIHMANIFERMKKVELASELSDTLAQLKRPIIFATYGSITCPDCAVAVPILEKMQQTNPLVKTIYFDRDNRAREFLLDYTGRNRIPTIFTTDTNGTVIGDFYVEFPGTVYRLVEGSKDDEERKGHIKEFRSGKYDEDVQSDLAGMIRKILD